MRHWDADRWVMAVAATIVVLSLLVAAAVVGGSVRRANACERSGGHMVEYGYPTYVMVGKVMVPVRETRCER